MTEKHLLYQLARLIANPEKLSKAAWGQQAGYLLQELHKLDPAQYEKLVETPVPTGHDTNETPLCWTNIHEILTELTKRTTCYSIAFSTKDQSAAGIKTYWWGNLSTAVGVARRLWLHMDALVRRQIREGLDNPEQET